MRFLGGVLTLAISSHGWGQALAPSTQTATGLEPLTVTAPRQMPDAEVQVLQTGREGGAGLAVAGAGLMGFMVVAGGPIGWAAALMFVGGTGSYLSDRRLDGREDFIPRDRWLEGEETIVPTTTPRRAP